MARWLIVASVRLGGAESLMEGVEASARPFEPTTYCECERGSLERRCGVSLDVNFCDLRQGHSTFVLNELLSVVRHSVRCTQGEILL